MAEQENSLLPYYQGWENYQDLLIKSIEGLSLEQLAVRPGRGLRSIGENAAHIVGTRAGWFYYTMKIGNEGLVKFAEWGGRPDQPAHSAAELIAGLKFTWQVIHDALSSWTVANLSDIVHDTDDSGKVYDLTRQWVIWHLIEHDLHHGGELSFSLGISGLPGISI